MKKSEKDFIQETKEFWQPYYGEKFLTDEDAREIYKNVTGLFSLLIKLEVRRMREQEELAKLKAVTKQDSNKQEEIEPKERLIPVTKWNDYYDYPKLGGLRALIFNEHTNGFDKVIRRIGRRVLIKEDAFFQWVEENNLKKY